MCVGQLRSLHAPMGNVTSFIVPILEVKSSLARCPTRIIIVFLSIKSFSASSLATRVLPPKTQFHLQEICPHQLTAHSCTFSEPVAQTVGESLFVLPPTEGMKHKVTLPISLWWRRNRNDCSLCLSVSLPLTVGFRYLGLLLVHPDSSFFFFFWTSLTHTHCTHAHTQSPTNPL